MYDFFKQYFDSTTKDEIISPFCFENKIKIDELLKDLYTACFKINLDAYDSSEIENKSVITI